jgi:hypothetical protein
MKISLLRHYAVAITMTVDEISTSETSVNFYETTGAVSLKTVIFTLATVKT